MMPEVHTCVRCKKKYGKDGGAVSIKVWSYRFAVMGTLCADCLEELQKWILKGTEDIQKTQDIEQAQLDKAYEIGYQLGYEDGKLCNAKEEE